MTSLPSSVLADARAAVVAAAVTLLLGAPAGLLWASLAPRPDTVIGQDGRPGLIELETSEFLDVDLVFLGVVIALGVGVGLLTWRFLRRHGPAVPIGLALGGVGAGVVARVVGRRVVVDEPVERFCALTADEPFCTLFDGRLMLGSPQLVLGLAVAAVLTYGLLVLVAERPRTISSG